MESYGLYANTLPLFISRRETETVKEFLKRIQNMLFEQQKYAGCDYEELANAMGFSEQMYDISISYRPKKLFPADMHNVGLELFNGCSEIPLRIFVDELDGQLHFTLQYQCACYQRKEIDAIYPVSYTHLILYLNDFNQKILHKLFSEYGLEFHPILDCHIYVYMWKGHPLADKEELTLEELEDYPCLAFEQGNNNSFYFAEEVLSTYHYKQLIRANDRATLLNLMVCLLYTSRCV